MDTMKVFWLSMFAWTVLVVTIAVFYERREQRNHARWLENTRANRVRLERWKMEHVEDLKGQSDERVITLEDMLNIRPVGINHGDESRPE